MTFHKDIEAVRATIDIMLDEYPFLNLENDRDMQTIVRGLEKIERWASNKEPAYNMPNPSHYFNTVNRALLITHATDKALEYDETGDMLMKLDESFEIFFTQLKTLERSLLAYHRDAVQTEISELVQSIPEQDFRQQLKAHLLDTMNDKDLMMYIFENFSAHDDMPTIKDSRYQLEYTMQVQERAKKIFKDLLESL